MCNKRNLCLLRILSCNGNCRDVNSQLQHRVLVQLRISTDGVATRETKSQMVEKQLAVKDEVVHR